MEFSDILHCKSCQELFDSFSRRPLILKCGHTFCEICLKSRYDSEKITCPLDSIDSFFDDFLQISVNYLILEAIETQKASKTPEKYCQVHKTQTIRFFCQSHKHLLCQECLILHHLGPEHVIVSSENIVLLEPLKQAMGKIIERLKGDKEKIEKRIKEVAQEFHSHEHDLKMMRKGLEDLIEKNFAEVLSKKQKEVDQEVQKVSKFTEKIEKITAEAHSIEALLSSLPLDLVYVTDERPDLLDTLKKSERFLFENFDFTASVPNPKPVFSFVEPPLLSKDEMNELIRLQIPTYDKKNRKLLTILKEEGILKSDLVFQTMMVINRRNFLPEGLISRAYQDNPLSIGWNTTISAPHMHANTLEELKSHLKKAAKAIDIGCGSGYMTACMAEIMGPNGKVIGLDHIEDILAFARGNIQKKNQYLLDSGRVELVNADGRKGYADGAPYDVIHVGGALAQVPQEMLDQLAKGGRMWIPVGPTGCQAIYVYDKDMNGSVKQQKLFNVSYGALTNVESQMQFY